MSYPARSSWRGQGGQRNDPFAGFEAVQERLSRLLGYGFSGQRGGAQWHPDIDVDENEDGWMVEVRLPGVAPEEVSVDLNDRELVIRSVDQEDSSAGSRYSSFLYRLTVPSDVDPDAIDATMDHGLLVVRLPRTTTSRSRRISVGRSGTQAAVDAGQAATPAGGSSQETPAVSDTAQSGESAG